MESANGVNNDDTEYFQMRTRKLFDPDIEFQGALFCMGEPAQRESLAFQSKHGNYDATLRADVGRDCRQNHYLSHGAQRP